MNSSEFIAEPAAKRTTAVEASAPRAARARARSARTWDRAKNSSTTTPAAIAAYTQAGQPSSRPMVRG